MTDWSNRYDPDVDPDVGCSLRVIDEISTQNFKKES